MKYIFILFIILILFLIFLCYLIPEYLGLCNFIVLSITLLVLIRYAFDTYNIAKINYKMWEQGAFLGVTYNINFIENNCRTIIRIINTSNLSITATVNCNLKINDIEIQSYPQFDGTRKWKIQPMESVQEWFELEDLFKKIIMI
jgi:hypothetical protein